MRDIPSSLLPSPAARQAEKREARQYAQCDDAESDGGKEKEEVKGKAGQGRQPGSPLSTERRRMAVIEPGSVRVRVLDCGSAP